VLRRAALDNAWGRQVGRDEGGADAYWGAKEKGYSPAEEAVITMLGLKSCDDELAERTRLRWVLRV
jgi:hypothetical protein